MDALLENVFSHTPDGAPVRVSVTSALAGGGSYLVDDGPGFTAPPGAAAIGIGSTGLGLDIARRTAQAAGGSMRQGRSRLGGALVELTFSPA